jgi:Ca2+-binding EF-hand superfamily protein
MNFLTNSHYKSVFLKNGDPVLDLYDIPDEDKYIYVSTSVIFKGLTLVYTINKKQFYKNKILNNKTENTFYRSDNKNIGLARKREIFKAKLNYLKSFKKKTDFKFVNQKEINSHKNFKKKLKYGMNNGKLNRSTILCEESDNDEWNYLSESEPKKSLRKTLLEKRFNNNKYLLFLFFNESTIEVHKILSKIKKDKQNKKTEKKIEELIDAYQQEYKGKVKKFEDYIKLKKKRFKVGEYKVTHTSERFNPIREQTKDLMQKFLQKMEIIKVGKIDDFDEMHVKCKTDRHLKFLEKNKAGLKNIYFNLDKQVDKFYPTLIYFNIPKLMELYKNFDRRELYELFAQYKVLMKLCVALNKSLKFINNGIDFRTFWKGVPQMRNEGMDLAEKMFNVINERKNNYMSLDEFFQGMAIIKSNKIEDKIDMFFKIIDSDGNGLLSYDEVYEISLMSLQRNVSNEEGSNEQVINELAEYFANLIFKLVNVDREEEIPLPVIKERIIVGGEEAKYLEMFCCTDGFQKQEKVVI